MKMKANNLNTLEETKKDPDLKFIYEYGKRLIKYRQKHFPDYKLRFSLVRVGSKKRVLKWISEEEFLDFEKLKEYYENYWVVSIDATLLPNEIVIECDMETQILQQSILDLIKQTLQKLNLKYLPIWSGGKSVHFHIWLKEYDVRKLRKIKELLYNYLKEKIPNLDLFGFKENHPYRLPGSLHPETLQRAQILLDEYTMQYIDIYNQLSYDYIIESDVPHVITEKFKELEQQKQQTKITISSQKSSGKLRKLYYELLNTKIEDGRDRVACILFTIASFLNIPPEQFENDFKKWIELCEWKEYRGRWFIEAYKKKEKYYWHNNWRWAIKQFLTATNIEKEDYEKVKRVILKYLPWAEKYLK